MKVFNRLLLGRWAVGVVLVALAGPAGAQESYYDWQGARPLHPAIRHARVRVESPHPMNVNCLRIDTRWPGLSFYTTPRCDAWEANRAETVRQTTREFLRDARRQGRPMVVAINADAWTPWSSEVWDQPTRPNLHGLAVSDGVLVSPGSGSPSFLARKDRTVAMATTDATIDRAAIQTAVSGFAFVLRDGQVLRGNTDRHPRTGIGLSADNRWVLFLTIDGRQPASSGATCPELGRWLQHFGAQTGINMDGGGSTTMVWWDHGRDGPDKTVLLNVPVGNGRNPGAGERRNGNNLGVCCPEPGEN